MGELHWKRYLVVAAIGALVAISAYTAYLRARLQDSDRTLAENVEQAAAAQGGLVAKLLKERDLVKRLSQENVEFLKRLQSVDARVRPAIHVGTVATIEDAIVLGPDERRFRLSDDLKTLFRRQRFHLDVIVVRNLDGKINIGNVSLTELDPDTEAPLDSEFTLESEMQVTDYALQKSLPSVLHPRVVGGIESHGYPLVGVEVLNLERFGGMLAHANLSLFAVWNPRDKNVVGGASIAWRLFNSNISIGPAYFTNGTFGGAVTVELTR